MRLRISASSSPSHSPPSQSKLDLSEQVSHSLKHQLEVQRERAAAALNKIQKQYSEESGRLRQDKTSLEQETEQAKATLLHKERSLNAAMATKMELQMEIQRMSEERNEIKGELRKEVCVCVCVCDVGGIERRQAYASIPSAHNVCTQVLVLYWKLFFNSLCVYPTHCA